MSTPSSGRGGRRPSKTVVLKLPSARLTQFPHSAKPSSAATASAAVGSKPAADSKASSRSPSTPSALGKESPSQQQQHQQQQQQGDAADEVKTEAPNDNSNLQVPAEGKKRGGARPGGRRGLGPDGLPKPRGKPGPKRRKLLDANGAMGEPGQPWSTTAPLGSKLGPKANQGAINAGLRALDRTGAPCRRWAKRGFTVKSFTGVVWELPSWSAPKREEKDDGEDEGDGEGDGENAEGDDRPPPESSNVGSEVPNKDMNGATDSPAPMVEAAA